MTVQSSKQEYCTKIIFLCRLGFLRRRKLLRGRQGCSSGSSKGSLLQTPPGPPTRPQTSSASERKPARWSDDDPPPVHTSRVAQTLPAGARRSARTSPADGISPIPLAAPLDAEPPGPGAGQSREWRQNGDADATMHDLTTRPGPDSGTQLAAGSETLNANPDTRRLAEADAMPAGRQTGRGAAAGLTRQSSVPGAATETQGFYGRADGSMRGDGSWSGGAHQHEQPLLRAESDGARASPMPKRLSGYEENGCSTGRDFARQGAAEGEGHARAEWTANGRPAGDQGAEGTSAEKLHRQSSSADR